MAGFVKRVEKPWGYEIHFTPPDLPYMGKILHIEAGKRLSLQYHDQKTESWYLLKGKVTIILDGEEINMEPGLGYTTQVGQKHRLVGVLDSDVLEVSTPEIGNTFGGKDHTTVMHSCKKIEHDINNDVELRKTVEQLTTGLMT